MVVVMVSVSDAHTAGRRSIAAVSRRKFWALPGCIGSVLLMARSHCCKCSLEASLGANTLARQTEILKKCFKGVYEAAKGQFKPLKNIIINRKTLSGQIWACAFAAHASPFSQMRDMTVSHRQARMIAGIGEQV
ncbi:MAG: hypothetical protein ACTS2Z_03765 [Glycocaulis sp.]